MYVLSSWHLCQYNECDYMRPMRSGSLRDVSPIIFVRVMRTGSLHCTRGIEHVHGVRSGKVRTGLGFNDLRRMSQWYEKQRRRHCMSVVRGRYVCMESVGCDDLRFLSSWHLRQHVECD